jgi:hypothetical protein
MGKLKEKIIIKGCRLYESGYHRTKVKEFLKNKTPRTSITINDKKESLTINGFPINKNGKVIY